MQNYDAGDLLEIRLTGSKKTELVPFTRAVVPKVDLEARRVTIVMPETVEGEEQARDSASESHL